MTAAANTPEPAHTAESEEANYRRTMDYVIDKLWKLRLHGLAMALLHDLLDEVALRREAERDGV